jgi:hypothetical protein
MDFTDEFIENVGEMRAESAGLPPYRGGIEKVLLTAKVANHEIPSKARNPTFL